MRNPELLLPVGDGKIVGKKTKYGFVVAVDWGRQRGGNTYFANWDLELWTWTKSVRAAWLDKADLAMILPGLVGTGIV